MELTFWEKVLRAFQYDQTLWHNIFLTIIYIIIVFLLFITIRDIISCVRNRKPISIRSIFSMLIMPLIIPVGIFLVLSISLTDASSIEPGEQMEIYHMDDGQTVAALAVGNFQANETGRYGTYGKTKNYAVLIAPESGKQIWQTKLARGSEVALIGRTKQKLWYFADSGLQVLHAQTGDILAEKEDFGDIQKQFPNRQEDYVIKNDQLYFKGLDGQFYQIDPDQLKGKVATEGISDQDFPDSMEEKGFMTADVVANPERNSLLAFLSDKEATAIQTGNDLEIAAEPQREFLYQTTFLQNGKLTLSDDQKVSEHPFIQGAFILDTTKTQPDDRFAKMIDYEAQVPQPQSPDFNDYNDVDTYLQASDDYQESLNRYLGQADRFFNLCMAVHADNSTKWLPMETKDKNWLILHKENVEWSANLKISALNPESKAIEWTTGLETSEVTNYKQDGDHLIILTPDSTLDLNLKTGKITGYSFDNKRSFTLQPE
ncbi:PA2928 family protein [Listeria ilorinensis]|uniref:PA2928 family protein n=1 Tax=Listeria ilorinensis TaxID=2867439 RepID=UPI001EF6DBD6|nr:PA2928 family protein [Listeria ilorinensis]